MRYDPDRAALLVSLRQNKGAMADLQEGDGSERGRGRRGYGREEEMLDVGCRILADPRPDGLRRRGLGAPEVGPAGGVRPGTDKGGGGQPDLGRGRR